MKGEELVEERAPADAWLIAAAGWAVPGVGHIWQGRWGRGLIIASVIWLMFLIGMYWGGHLYPVNGHEEGLSSLLQVPPAIADLGSGLPYLVCWATNTGFSDEPQNAARATFEYGNVFLWVAGLLNYLAMLDAFDIRAGRKP
jgi:hypothetical protein